MLIFFSSEIIPFWFYFENLNPIILVISVNLKRWFTDRKRQTWGSEFYTANFFIRTELCNEGGFCIILMPL